MSKSSLRDEPFNFELRLRSLLYLILAMLAALAIRFWVLQVSHYQSYQQQAENNRIREIPIIAPRGAILDSYSKPLVDNTPAFNIVVSPDLMTSLDETVKVLVEELNIDRTEAVAQLSDLKRPKSQPVLVKQNATRANRQWVSAHEYEHPEISAEEQPQRVYKYGKLASQVLGHIGQISSTQLEEPKFQEFGYRPGDIIGQAGLERTYDQILRGKNGKRIVVVDSRGRTIRELQRVEPIKGLDIVTTLDLDIQQTAEEQFDAANQTGIAVVMNPQNGEVLAMVSKPSFDPNVFAEHVISAENRDEVRAITNNPTKPLLNKAIQEIYPTGSTWKVMMTTAAMEEGIITPSSSRFACGGGIQVGNRFVHCMGSHGSPEIHYAVVHSCDGYFYRLGLKMGVDLIHDWVVRFGMGQRTGIDLPHEQKGFIPDRATKPNWKDFDTVLASVGQGSVAVTPIQLLRAEAGIIMGGEFHTPHLMKKVLSTEKAPEREYEDKPVYLKLSKTTIDTVSYAVWGVVNEGGTGTAAALPGFNIGGKTGTAQVIAKEKVRTKEHQDHGWFISFAPVHTEERPEIAMVVLTEHGGQGGRTSAPKTKMIFASYYSKKLGHPVVRDFLARNDQPAQITR